MDDSPALLLCKLSTREGADKALAELAVQAIRIELIPKSYLSSEVYNQISSGLTL